jgi:hypothetical protein
MAGGEAVTLRDVLRTQLRILTFRFGQAELGAFDSRLLIFGLATAWLAGVGRYWDHPDPYLIQRLGIGSLLIPIVLSALLYGLLRPLRPERWSYVHLLTFVSLTSLPAVLYAIPVERFLTLPQARSANVAFLGVVAAWRVALLGAYLYRSARLSPLVTAVALLLPLALIILALSILNLERAVFDLMSGLRDDGTPSDSVYAVLVILTMYAFIGSPILVALYLIAIFVRWRSTRPAAQESRANARWRWT